MLSITNVKSIVKRVWDNNAPTICEDLNIEIPPMEIIEGREEDYLGCVRYSYTKNMFDFFSTDVKIGDLEILQLNAFRIKSCLNAFLPFMKEEIIEKVILYVIRHELRHVYQLQYNKPILEQQIKLKNSSMRMFRHQSEGFLPAEVDADNYAVAITETEAQDLITRYMIILHKGSFTKNDINEAKVILRSLAKIYILPKAKVVVGIAAVVTLIGYIVCRTNKSNK